MFWGKEAQPRARQRLAGQCRGREPGRTALSQSTAQAPPRQGAAPTPTSPPLFRSAFPPLCLEDLTRTAAEEESQLGAHSPESAEGQLCSSGLEVRKDIMVEECNRGTQLTW